MIGFDIQKMMKQAQKMQDDMNSVQAELERLEVQGSAGGGAVTVYCNGKQEFSRVKITKEALEDSEMLEDLVLAALKDANQKVADATRERMASVTAGLNIPGLNLPGF